MPRSRSTKFTPKSAPAPRSVPLALGRMPERHDIPPPASRSVPAPTLTPLPAPSKRLRDAKHLCP